MQDYKEIAKKNGVILRGIGACQFCGAQTERGVHECVEIFSLGFQELDFSQADNHIYRFYIVDAHTLQHSELHGRWNNHFHLSRLHLIFHHKVRWTYQLSPLLSDYLNIYKANHPNEVLESPPVLKRGHITSTYVKASSYSSSDLKNTIENWARTVYGSWSAHHDRVDHIAQKFLGKL